MVTYLPGWCQAIQIHAVRKMECSSGLMIRDRQAYCLDHTQLMHAAIIMSRILCRDEVDQLQEAASTNEVPLGDSYPFSRILLGRPSWPH